MEQSATTPRGRDARRQQTADRITRRAQELTLERGLDGFTMDELADAAEVSRRTLFNYFPGKTDAVLGAIPSVEPELLAVFRAGGPHGDLVADVEEIARALLTTSEPAREDLVRSRRVLEAEPRLIAAAHTRFGALIEEYLEEIRLREGTAFDPQRAQIVVRVHAVLFDHALDAFLADPGSPPLDELYAQTVRRARAVLAPAPH